jgi:C-terminal processing protease CtpA/Prc
MTPDLRAHFGAPRDAGVLVGEVEADGPAAKAGLQVGDVVTAVDGEKIDSGADLSRAIRGKKNGETVKLEVLRDKAKKTLSVAVAERKRTEIARNDARPRLREHTFTIPDFEFRWPNRLDLDRLSDRLEELEKRLKDLEKKLPAR